MRSKSSRSLLSTPLARIWLSLPSTISRCLLRNHVGILYWVGFCMMVTMRSSSSEVSSPALLNHLCQLHILLKIVRLMHASIPLVEVDIGLLADQVGVALANALD